LQTEQTQKHKNQPQQNSLIIKNNKWAIQCNAEQMIFQESTLSSKRRKTNVQIYVFLIDKEMILFRNQPSPKNQQKDNLMDLCVN
jgi:hypothetical protein